MNYSMINRGEFFFLYVIYMYNCYQVVYVFRQYVQILWVKSGSVLWLTLREFVL